MKSLDGCIGHSPCETSLENILMEIGDGKMARSVIRALLVYKEGLGFVHKINNTKIRGKLDMAWLDMHKLMINNNAKWPVNVREHMLACLYAYHRASIIRNA